MILYELESQTDGVDFLGLEAAEPTFDHHVVSPTAFAVHALADLQGFQQFFVPAAGELCSLITVDNSGDAILCGGFFYRMDDMNRVKRVRKIPADDFAAIPIDDRSQIHVSMQHLDAGDINRSYLIRHVYLQLFIVAIFLCG